MNLFQEAKQVLDKDGKVNALGPYGKQKLTGREMSTYFRRNKVKDAQIKKAVEVALDLGGADSIARREIKKFYGDKILKSKEVQQALQYANEEVFKEDLSKEDAVLEENYRVLAKKGMGAETKNSIKVGTEVDYYRDDGAKYMGKIIKMGPKSYIVKDMKNGKNYQFMYHDRVQAKKYLKQGDNINEKLDLVLTVKGDKNVALALKAMKNFRGISIKRQGKVRSGQVAVFGGDEKQLQKMQSSLAGKIGGLDMVSTHEMVSVNEADAEKKAELALKQTREKDQLAKKHEREKESIADSYRRMWEDGVLEEEVANITVDPRNKISKPADQNKHAMEIVKQAKRFGLKSSMMGKHVRLKGGKKAVNDFLRLVIGKSSYGDPTEKDMSTPQIDKMLTKELK